PARSRARNGVARRAARREERARADPRGAARRPARVSGKAAKRPRSASRAQRAGRRAKAIGGPKASEGGPLQRAAKVGIALAWHCLAWEELVALVVRAEELGFDTAYIDGDISQLAQRHETDVLDG